MRASKILIHAGLALAQVLLCSQGAASHCIKRPTCDYGQDCHKELNGRQEGKHSMLNEELDILLTITTVTYSHARAMTTSTGFPSTDGLTFSMDRKTKYFAGSNACWASFLTVDSDVDLVMDHLVTSGLRILRIWGFNDVNSKPSTGTVYFQLLQDGTATINTGPDGLQRLGYVVAAAEKRKIKLIINFVNYWSDYAGMEAYVAAYGGDKTSWYTDEAIQAAYRKYVKTVISRYIDSPAIFA